MNLFIDFTYTIFRTSRNCSSDNLSSFVVLYANNCVINLPNDCLVKNGFMNMYAISAPTVAIYFASSDPSNLEFISLNIRPKSYFSSSSTIDPRIPVNYC